MDYTSLTTYDLWQVLYPKGLGHKSLERVLTKAPQAEEAAAYADLLNERGDATGAAIWGVCSQWLQRLLPIIRLLAINPGEERPMLPWLDGEQIPCRVWRRTIRNTCVTMEIRFRRLLRVAKIHAEEAYVPDAVRCALINEFMQRRYGRPGLYPC
jgi:hypothetical protein